MDVLVIALLGGLWAAILLPGLLRGRRERSPLVSIDEFERSMGILAAEQRRGGGRGPGREVLVVADPRRLAGHPARMRVLARRRAMVRRLGALAGAAVLAAALWGGPLLPLAVVAVAAFGGYVLVLARVHAREVERQRTLRSLPRVAPARAARARPAAWAGPHGRLSRSA